MLTELAVLTVLTVWTVLTVSTVFTLWTEITENLKKYDLLTYSLLAYLKYEPDFFYYILVEDFTSFAF